MTPWTAKPRLTCVQATPARTRPPTSKICSPCWDKRTPNLEREYRLVPISLLLHFFWLWLLRAVWRGRVLAVFHSIGNRPQVHPHIAAFADSPQPSGQFIQH